MTSGTGRPSLGILGRSARSGPTRRAVMAVVSLSIAAACGGSDGSSPDLAGTDWALVDDSLGVPVPEPVDVTISFSGDTVSGNAGCNTYTGSYTSTSDGTITVGPLATTRKACVPDVAAVEVAYLELLGTVSTYEFDGDELRLGSDSSALRFLPAP